MTSWESDQLIVLSEWESRLQGEGADVNTKPIKETLTVHEGTDSSATSMLGIANKALSLAAEASIHEEPGAENRTPGSVRGLSGNW